MNQLDRVRRRMKIYNLDDPTVEREFNDGRRRFDHILTVGEGLAAASIGDSFLAPCSAKFFERSSKKIAFLAHPNHIEVASFFGSRLYAFLATRNPASFYETLCPSPDYIHCERLKGASLKLGSRTIPEKSIYWKTRLSINRIWNPWNYFILNRTDPSTRSFDIRADSDLTLPKKSIKFCPERSDRKLLSSGMLEGIASFAKSNEYAVYTNIVENQHYSNPLVVENTQPISPSLTTLIGAAQNDELVLIGTRSGIFDILFFTSKAKLVMLYPTGSKSVLYRSTFNNIFAQVLFGNVWKRRPHTYELLDAPGRVSRNRRLVESVILGRLNAQSSRLPLWRSARRNSRASD